MAQRWDMKTFMKGASILTISAIIVKILSAVYRVPYQNMVGDKGFYIYQQVYPFIGIFIVWTSYGFAVAVSKLLAGYERVTQRRAMMRIAFVYLFILSALFFVFLTVFAPSLARAMGDPQLVGLIRAGAYIVVIMPFLAVLKGQFQSTGEMIPVAVSGVGEQAVRVAIVLVGTWIAMQTGASLYDAGEVAMWGAVIGELSGVIILALYMRRAFIGPVEHVRIWPVVKELTIVSISVSASSLILLFFQLIDSFTILNTLLEMGTETEEAMAVKGVYDRGQPLVQMGILIATTLALAIVPLISHQATRKNGRGEKPFIQTTYRVALLFGVAASVGLMLVLPYVNEMLFETRDGSLTLIIFVFQILWLSLLLPLTAILQGAGRIAVPTLLLCSGVVLKWLMNEMLIPIFGVAGAAIAGNGSLIIVVIGVLCYFKRIYSFALATMHFYKWLAIATVAMIIAVLPWLYMMDHLLFHDAATRSQSAFIALSAVGIGAFVFLLIVLQARLLKEKEWYLLPFGKRFARIPLSLVKRKGE